MPATTWGQMAEEAVQTGYQPGNALESLLRSHMQEHLPKLTSQLGQDFEDFLICRTNSAIEMQADLIGVGVHPRLARAMMMAELLPLGEDDQAEAEALLQSELDPDRSSEASPIEAGSTQT